MSSFYSAKFLRDSFLGPGDSACTDWVKANPDATKAGDKGCSGDGDCGAQTDCLHFAAHCLNEVRLGTMYVILDGILDDIAFSGD